MEEKKKMLLDDEEYNIIQFYRQLPETKKAKFLKLLNSLRKILLEEKDDL